MKRVLILILILTMSGCYHLAGMVVESRTKSQRLLSTHDRMVPLPKRTQVALSVSTRGTSLHVKATEIKWCRSEKVDTYQGLEKVERRLPASHWAVLLSGLVFAGAGAATWAVGDSMLPTAYTYTVDDPQTESARDRGHVLVPVGISLTSLAAVFIASYISDSSMLKNSTKKLAKTEKALNQGTGPCSRTPADKLKVALHLPRLRGLGDEVTTLETNAKGEASIAFLGDQLGNLPYGAPFLIATCDRCQRIPVTLPIALAARLVMKRRNEGEMTRWLTEHPQHFMKKDVEKVLAKVIAERKSKEKVPADKRILTAHNMLTRGKRLSAIRELKHCLLDHPKNRGCQHLLANSTRRQTTTLAAQSRMHLRWRRPIQALVTAENCLFLNPRFRPCLTMKRAASSRWLTTNQAVRFRLKAIQTEGGVTSVRGDIRVPRKYAEVYVGIRVHRGRRIICRDRQTLTDLKRNRNIGFQGICEDMEGTPDRVSVRIEGWRL